MGKFSMFRRKKIHRVKNGRQALANRECRRMPVNKEPEKLPHKKHYKERLETPISKSQERHLYTSSVTEAGIC